MHDDSTTDIRRLPQPVLDRVSANLREARQDAGLTQEELAERSELHPTQVERLEQGATLPHLDTLAKLAGALDVPPADLCAGVVWDPERQRFE
jgi:transcriptional regulator with XRE-family HTH domain